MSAKIIDGKAIAQQVRIEWKVRTANLRGRGVVPGLAVIIIGDNPASLVYIRHKTRACAEIGIHSEVHAFSAEVSEAEVLAKIEALNIDPQIHGILVQLPLPPRFGVRVML